MAKLKNNHIISISVKSSLRKAFWYPKKINPLILALNGDKRRTPPPITLPTTPMYIFFKEEGLFKSFDPANQEQASTLPRPSFL